MDVLLPYLDEYWRSYIDDATIRARSGCRTRRAPATTGRARAGTHEELAAVLERDAPRGARS